MRFTYFLPGWAVVLGIGVVIGITLLVYLRIAHAMHPRYRFLLVAMRICAASILLCCLLAPVVIEKKDITPPTHLSVLVDTSRSMQLVDTPTDEPQLSRLDHVNALLFREKGQFLQSLRDRFEVHLYPFDTSLHQRIGLPEDFDNEGLPQFEPNGTLTNIRTAIQAAAAAWKGQQTAGILLITDGGHNTGQFPMDDITALEVPIYTVGVGSVEPPKDIQIQRIDYTPIAYTNHENVIRVTVMQTGYTGKTTQVSLRDIKGNTVVETAALTFKSPQNIASAVTTTKQEVELKLTPQVEGNFQYTVELPVLDGELTEANNRKTFSMKVVKAKLNVFYLESRPRWEYTFLKRVLARDPHIEATCAILLRNKSKRFPPTDSLLNGLNGYYPQTTPASETTRFPETLAKLSEYDILILGDLGEEHLTTAQQRAIVNFVEVQGKPVIFLASRRMLGINGIRHTELAGLLPIEIPANGCRRHDSESRVQLTRSGEFHPMLQLMDTALLDRSSAAIWQNLPALSRTFSTFPLRAGATLLMETEEGRPILMFQRAGLGKSLLIAAEGLWNWDFGANGFKDTRYHDLYSRFWAQALRWMATNTNDQKLHLTTDATTYTIGDTAKVTASLYSKVYRRTQLDATVQFEVVPPEGNPFQLQIQGMGESADESPLSDMIADTSNLYTTQFALLQNGTYRIRATAKSGSQTLGEDHIDIFVHPQLAELEAPQLNEGLLKSIASETGGTYFSITDAESMPKNIADVQNSVFVDAERDLWTHPLILLTVVGLLGTEWFLRKRIGLT